MTTTDNSSQATVLPSGTEIHDILMASIEPDLVTVNLPFLEEKYQNETAEERKSRAERYTSAIEKYDEKVERFFAKVKGTVETYKIDAMQRSLQSDTKKMKNIEGELSDNSYD